MKKIVFTTLLTVMLMTTITIADASIIQIQEPTNSWHQIKYYQPIGQTFTAESTYYSDMGVSIGDKNTGLDDLTIHMRFFKSDLDFSLASMMFKTEILLTAGDDYAIFDLSSYIFDIGSIYTVAFYNDTARWGIRMNSSTDYYSEGSAFFSGVATGYDTSFYVNSNVPVPEPSTFLLLGGGLAGLAFVARRRRK